MILTSRTRARPRSPTRERSRRGDLVALATQDHHRWYGETNNGAHVWCAYVQARQLRAIPGWVVEYFDQVAARLIAPDGTKDPEAIAKALKLFTKGGGPTARERALTRKRDGIVRQSVARARDRYATVDEAALTVGAAMGLSDRNVKAIVYRKLPTYKKLPK